MANRDRHRQGLVYGPVRPSGPRDRGRIVGNLLGLLVVVVTVAVLGIAIYFIAQSRGSDPAPPAPVASETAVPPSVEATVSVDATGQPSPSAVAVASDPAITPAPGTPTVPPSTPPEVTPGPTIFVPTVMVGPGFVTFGTTADDQLAILDPKTTFAIDEPMVWSAHLTELANSVDLRIRILKLDASQPSGESLVREDPVKPDVTGAQIFFRRLRPIGTTSGPGLYTIEYVRGDLVLSSGSFLVQ